MPEAHRINLAADFSAFPFGRNRRDGEDNGERFRQEWLIPVLRKFEKVELDIDGVAGLPSSFWEEAIGGLVRVGFSPTEVREKLSIVTRDPELEPYVRLAWRYVDEAAEQIAQ